MARVIAFPQDQHISGMIGRRVLGIDGPGQSESNPGNRGTIVAEDNNRWGSFWAVEWDGGHQEPISKHSLKSTKEINGIGVYFI